MSEDEEWTEKNTDKQTLSLSESTQPLIFSHPKMWNQRHSLAVDLVSLLSARLASDWIGEKLLLFLSWRSMEGWKSKQAVAACAERERERECERERNGRRKEGGVTYLQSSATFDDWLSAVWGGHIAGLGTGQSVGFFCKQNLFITVLPFFFFFFSKPQTVYMDSVLLSGSWMPLCILVKAKAKEGAYRTTTALPWNVAD